MPTTAPDPDRVKRWHDEEARLHTQRLANLQRIRPLLICDLILLALMPAAILVKTHGTNRYAALILWAALTGIPIATRTPHTSQLLHPARNPTIRNPRTNPLTSITRIMPMSACLGQFRLRVHEVRPYDPQMTHDLDVLLTAMTSPDPYVRDGWAYEELAQGIADGRFSEENSEILEVAAARQIGRAHV